MNWVIFTAPNGAPLLVDLTEMSLVRRALPAEKEMGANASIHSAGHAWVVRETFEQIVDAMIRNGIKICWLDGTDVTVKVLTSRYPLHKH
jgi:hypothetical protein